MNGVAMSIADMSSGMGWISRHPLLSIFILIAVIIVLFTVVIPLFFKLFRKSKKISETSDLHKDLMIWSNLSRLVRGGEEAVSAKRDISTKIHSLKMFFLQGLHMLRGKRIGRYASPWFVLLGEPRSGKTTLLRNSELSLFTAGGESSDDVDHSLTCWLCAGAYVLDVPGKIFFDRWLESSSAEWDSLIRMINRARSRRPLDGIVLTIPADALLLDDEKLTKQKAAIIGAELDSLLLRTGMNLPCYVVVTKLDMLRGFSEYFSRVKQEDGFDYLFGWNNDRADGTFVVSEFAGFWKKLLDMLRGGVGSRIIDSQFFHGKDAYSGRQQTTSRIYLFPESFDLLETNLRTYLGMIFESNAWHGSRQLHLKGVHFTSSLDGGCVLTGRMTEGENPEPEMIQSKPAVRSSLFVRRLLKDVIFTDGSARTTPVKRFWVNLPCYLAIAAILLVGAVWLACGLSYEEYFQNFHGAQVDHYTKLASLVEQGALSRSPLLFEKKDGTVEICDRTATVDGTDIGRIQLFYNTVDMARQSVFAPWGFKTASLLCCNLNPNIHYGPRQSVANQVQTRMVFVPTVRLLRDRVLRKQSEPFTMTKREAMFVYTDLLLHCDCWDDRQLPEESFLAYLAPDASANIRGLLGTYNSRYQENNAEYMAPLIYDIGCNKAMGVLYTDFFNSWEKKGVYVDSGYATFQRLVSTCLDMDADFKAAVELASRNPAGANENAALMKEWHELLGRHRANNRKFAGDTDISQQYIARYAKYFGNTDIISKTAVELYAGYVYRDAIRILEEDRDICFGHLDKLHGRKLLAELKDDTFRKHFNDVEKSLQESKRALDVNLKTLIGSGALDMIARQEPKKQESRSIASALRQSDDRKPAMPAYISRQRLEGELLSIAANLESPGKLAKAGDYAVAYKDYSTRAECALARFDELLGQYPGNEHLNAAAAGIRRMLERQIAYDGFRLLREFLGFFPGTSQELTALVAGLPEAAGGMDVFGIPRDLLGESVGASLELPGQFVPAAAMSVFTPIADAKRICSAQSKEKDEKKEAATAIELPPELKKSLAIVGEFVTDYLNFWGGYVDSLGRRQVTADWREYKTAVARIKPYEVNAFLLTMYNVSENVLRNVPNELLNDEQKKIRDNYIAAFIGKKQVLTTDFSELCTHQNSHWQALPDDPVQAYNQLCNQGETTLKSDFLALVATGLKGDIPWWSNFYSSGIDSLKAYARKAIIETIGKDVDLFRFPVCSDAISKDVIGADELDKVGKYVSLMGFDAEPKPAEQGGEPGKADDKKAAPSPADELRNLNVAGDMTKDAVVWAKKLSQIVSALTHREKLPVWSISVLSLEEQQSLNAQAFPEMPLALCRYRYCLFTKSGKPLSKKLLLNGKAFDDAARGDFNYRDIDIRFFEFSGAPAETTVSFPGDWAVLRIYLLGHSIYDAKSKTLNVPVVVKDASDAKSILWLGVRMNKTLPLPAEWPSTNNWPDFGNNKKK
ncbi:MAG: hypothetical protein MJ025_02170 [Victivallaceae bacterium]|nr:hypothetical protein [Victivallaceae bacterium]